MIQGVGRTIWTAEGVIPGLGAVWINATRTLPFLSFSPPEHRCSKRERERDREIDAHHHPILCMSPSNTHYRTCTYMLCTYMHTEKEIDPLFHHKPCTTYLNPPRRGVGDRSNQSSLFQTFLFSFVEMWMHARHTEYILFFVRPCSEAKTNESLMPVSGLGLCKS